MLNASPTPPTIAPIWSCVMSIMMTHHQPMSDAGPGSRRKLVIVVSPDDSAYRPSSTCTNTLMKQLTMTTEIGRGDQLARADDRPGEDQARADLEECLPERRGRVNDGAVAQDVRVIGRLGCGVGFIIENRRLGSIVHW
jgi:hypothetical protein